MLLFQKQKQRCRPYHNRTTALLQICHDKGKYSAASYRKWQKNICRSASEHIYCHNGYSCKVEPRYRNESENHSRTFQALSIDNNFLDITSNNFRNILQVNLISPFLLIQKLYDIMEEGVIINISSTDGINTYSKLNIDYSASKAGLINLTKSLALELENIRIYAICPNWVNTESIKEMNQDYLKDELNRIGQKKLIEPKCIAEKVIKLIESDLKSGSIIVMEDNYE